MSTLEGSKLVLIRISVTKLPMRAPRPPSPPRRAPLRRRRARCGAGAAPRQPCRARRLSTRGSDRASTAAGRETMPVRMPVASAAAAATASTRRSTAMALTRATPSGIALLSTCTPHQANTHGEDRAQAGEHDVLHQQLDESTASGWRPGRLARPPPVRVRWRAPAAAWPRSRRRSAVPAPPRPAASASTSSCASRRCGPPAGARRRAYSRSTRGALPSARRQSAPSAPAPVPSSCPASSGRLPAGRSSGRRVCGCARRLAPRTGRRGRWNRAAPTG